MGKLHPTRQEYKTENTALKQKIIRLEACSEVKHLHKLEKEIQGLRVIIKTKDLHIIHKDKEISRLKIEIFQKESFPEKLERKSKEMNQLMKDKMVGKKLDGWKQFDALAEALIDIYINEEKKDNTLIGKIYTHKEHQILVEPKES